MMDLTFGYNYAEGDKLDSILWIPPWFDEAVLCMFDSTSLVTSSTSVQMSPIPSCMIQPLDPATSMPSTLPNLFCLTSPFPGQGSTGLLLHLPVEPLAEHHQAVVSQQVHASVSTTVEEWLLG